MSLSFRPLQRPLPWLLGLGAGGILLIGGVTYAIFFSGPRFDVEELTVPATSEALTVRIDASGTVVPIRSVNVSPKNAGIVQQLGVEQGAQVEQGQPLAQMDNAELGAQGQQAVANLQEAAATLEEARVRLTLDVDRARAQVQQARARLTEVEQRVPRDVQIANAEIVAAEERLQRAQERFERYQLPNEAGAVSQNLYDEAAIEFRAAQTNLNQAVQRNLQSQGTARPEIQQAGFAWVEAQAALRQAQARQQNETRRLEAAVAAAQARVQELQIRFRDTVIQAPFDGIVTQRYANEGAFVTPTTSASATASATSASILALADGLEVLARVPQVDLPRLQLGQPVEIRLDAFPDKIFRGRVRLIAPEAVVENNVTSFEVRIGLISGLEELKPGMEVNATFLGESLASQLVIPTIAIVRQDGETGVMALGLNNRPEFKPVQLGASIGDQTQVISGLEPGERVFIDLPEGMEPPGGEN